MLNNNPKILFISNGYGEDMVAAHIAANLKTTIPSSIIAAFPTVGSGIFYKKMSIKVTYQGIKLPSEGFIRSIKDFLKDISYGFIIKTLKMGIKLKSISKNFDYLIFVGDPYILLFSSLFSLKKRYKKIFIGIQQSELYQSKRPFKEHYSLIERAWMKLLAGIIFVRDIKTADFLEQKGFKNVYSFGNPMMDCFTIHDNKIFPENKTIIAILPGSKKEAYENLRVIFGIIKKLSKKLSNPIYAIALSPNLNLEKILNSYNLVKKDEKIINDNKAEITFFSNKNISGDIAISNSLFGNIIDEADVIIGTSGTANEQAAGMGKPIFSFWGKGPQITKKFLEAQKRLLGQSLYVFEPKADIISKKIIEVLHNKSLLRKIEDNGKNRMAGRGSINKTVMKIIKYISTCESSEIHL